MYNKKIFINAFYVGLFIITCHFYSCRNSNSIDNNALVSYEYKIGDKVINFFLPKEYSDKGISEKLKLKHYADNSRMKDSQIIFISSFNTDNNFSVFCINDSLIDNEYKKDIDKMITNIVYHNYALYPGTTFTERNIDKDGIIFFYIITTCRYPYNYKMSYFDFMETDSIYSKFEFLTYINNNYYSLILETIEHIKDFSYEDKRKILESITIK